MKYIITAIFFSALASCGTGSSGGSSGSKSDKSDNKDVPTEEEAAHTRTLALDSVDDLPACGDTNEHQLVYIIDESLFYTCKSKEWEEIEVADVELQDNEWYDRQTGWVWQVGANVAPDEVPDCSGNSTKPSESEIIAAIKRGLDYEIWVSEYPDLTYIDNNGEADEGTAMMTKRTACVFK